MLNKKLDKNQSFNAFLNTEIKSIVTDEETGSIIIEGYANTVVKDRAGDVIPSSAWDAKALSNYFKNPIMLAYHDHSRPIGTCLELTPDAYGLKIKAEIYDIDEAVYKLVLKKVLKSFSIGFSIKDCDYDYDHDVFTITELELYEISIVSVPCNQDSVFELTKSMHEDLKNQFSKTTKVKATNSQTEDFLYTLATQLGCLKEGK